MTSFTPVDPARPVPHKPLSARLTMTIGVLLAVALALPASTSARYLADAGGSDAGGGSAPATTTAASPETVSGPAAKAAAKAKAKYSFSMYRKKTHSVQKTDWYCVPASIQIMLNLTKGQSDKSRANQDKYWRYAQAHSRYPIKDNGADAAGWAAALRNWGAGNYTVGVHSTIQASLRAAAKRMRTTGKPVGLIVWGRKGGHAWVMTGFAATADPKLTANYTVTHAQVMGPLWPYGTIGGKSFDPGPKKWLPLKKLKKKFTVFVQKSAPAWNGRWLTVLP